MHNPDMPRAFGRRLENPLGLANIQTVDYHPDGVKWGGLYITRIHVPDAHQGKGIGSALLKECLAAADRTKTTLFLEIVPTGRMTYEQLEQWYFRHGFKGCMFYVRRPR